MGGQKQEHLRSIIGLLKKLGEMPASAKYRSETGYRREDATLFDELTGYSWQWSGQSWVKDLEQILAHYEAEAKRVKEAQDKKRFSHR